MTAKITLKEWFLQGKRSFPWRDNPTPYAVWISEVMLQQTRASVVVDYFERWMKLFPTIEALAQANLPEVIKAWEGLGYYSRARNIKYAAEMLVTQGRTIPNTLPELLQIKGIGPYTAGAILSFAFHQKAAAIDGNVIRVVSRYFGQEDKKVLESNTLSLLPEEEPWITMEALIELGATVCLKNPLCHTCPLQKECFAYNHDMTAHIPKTKKQQQIIHIDKHVALILHQDEILLYIVEEGKVLGGLAQFPSFPISLSCSLEEEIAQHLGLTVSWVEDLPQTWQSFTNNKETLFPCVFHSHAKKECNGFMWVKFEQLETLSFTSGHKRILSQTHILKSLI